MVATVNEGRPMMNAPVRRYSDLDLLKFVCNRFQRALVKYVPDLPKNNRFLCVSHSDRCLLVVRLAVIGGAVSPELAGMVQREMEGRRVVYREYPQFRVAVFQVAYRARGEDFQVMPPFQGRQVVIYGGTGGGKSTTIKHLLAGRQGTVVVIDPHYQRGTGQWHSRWLIAGAGGRFDEIKQVIGIVHAETMRRMRSTAPQESHQPLHVAIDEMSNIISDISDDAVRQIYEIVRQGRKYNVFMVLTPHSVEVRAMGIEGAGGTRESFLFVRMPHIRPGDERKPRVVDVFLGNPLKMSQPDGRYLIPPPVIYQGEPRVISPKELGALLGVTVSAQGDGASETMSEGVSDIVSEMGHGQDTGKSGVLADDESFTERYTRGSQAALDLAVYLVEHGYGVRKIGEFLPYRVEDARATAVAAMAETRKGVKPAAGSKAEAHLVRELYFSWGAPANRIARLLDGPDHINLQRVQEIIKIRSDEE